MISEQDIERAVEWMRDNAKTAAQARADRMYVEAYLKTIEAQLMAEKPDASAAAQMAHARADPRYIAHLQAIKEAVERDENMRWLMSAASAKVEVWRSQQANLRAEGRAYS